MSQPLLRRPLETSKDNLGVPVTEQRQESFERFHIAEACSPSTRCNLLELEVKEKEEGFI